MAHKNDMNAHLSFLFRERKSQFWRPLRRYFRYVAQSGFGLLVLGLLFTFLIGYRQLLHHVPVNWPIKEIGFGLLFIITAHVPFRTYLQSTDACFLLSAEKRIHSEYLFFCVCREMVIKTGWVGVCWLLYWPLYKLALTTASLAEARSVLGMFFLFLMLAFINARFGWLERTFVNRSLRMFLKSLRWLVTGLIVNGLLFHTFLVSLFFMGISVFLLRIVYQLPQKFLFPWERLIEEERQAVVAWHSFFSWFVDLPALTAKVTKRSWAAWIGENIPWDASYVWHYLYSKFFARGEIFGFLWKFVLISLLTMGWITEIRMASAVFVLSVFLIGLQLRELGKMAYTEPLFLNSFSAQKKGAAAVVRIIGMGITFLLSLALLIKFWLLGLQHFGILPVIAALSFGFGWSIWWIPRGMMNERKP